MKIIIIILVLLACAVFVFSLFGVAPEKYKDETEEEFLQRMKEYEDNKKDQK